MQKNCVTLLGSNDIFSGVVWRSMDEDDLEFTKYKIQEMLDACHSMMEKHAGHNNSVELDRLISNWQRTGLVERG